MPRFPVQVVRPNPAVNRPAALAMATISSAPVTFFVRPPATAHGYRGLLCYVVAFPLCAISNAEDRHVQVHVCWIAGAACADECALGSEGGFRGATNSC